MEILNTSGRRKTSVARIYMTSGQGNITINDRDIKEYFRAKYYKQSLTSRLKHWMPLVNTMYGWM